MTNSGEAPVGGSGGVRPPRANTGVPLARGITPAQTVGPFFAMRLPWPDGPFVVPEGTPGAITIVGRIYDGAGNVIPDGLVETWQADPAGRFAHPHDPRGPSAAGYQAFRGFGRCPTAPDGSYRIVTLKPGPLPAPDAGHGAVEAPHLDVSVFARGLLHRLVTRLYFPDEAVANDADPVLRSINDPGRRQTLIAQAEPADPGDPIRWYVVNGEVADFVEGGSA